MALQHNLPASGDTCVSVLNRLCTVVPSMYRVGVSKVSPAHAGPGPPAEGSCPRGHPWSWKMGTDPTSRPLPRLFTLPGTPFLPSSPPIQPFRLQLWPPWSLPKGLMSVPWGLPGPLVCLCSWRYLDFTVGKLPASGAVCPLGCRSPGVETTRSLCPPGAAV